MDGSGPASVLSSRASRRKILKGTGAGLAAGSALWLVGCGGDDDDDDDDVEETAAPSTATAAATSEATSEAEEESTEAAADQPRTGGKLNMVWIVEDSHLDPHTSSEHFSPELWRAAANGLLKQEALTNLPQPDLAESWEQPDDLTVIFTLTGGVKFHNKPPMDGREFSAEDAVFSLERMSTPEPDYRRATSFSSVESFTADDAQTVTVTLKEAYVPILSAISNKWSIMVAPELIEQFGDLKSGDSIIGTGPFLCEAANSSVGARLVRNPDYFIGGLPYLDEVEYVTIVDLASRDSGFRAGQFDVHTVVEPDLESWEEDDTLHVESFEGTVFHLSIISGKVDEAPFTDQRVRKAIDLAIDRDDLARAAWPGSSYRKSGVFPNLTWGIQPEEIERLPGFRAPKDEDIAEAISLMEAAGHGGGLEITVNTTNAYAEYHVTRAEALKPQLEKIGITLNLNLLEFGALKEAEVKKDFQYNLATYAYYDDPDFPLFNSLHSAGVRNYWNWSDPEYDAIVERQRQIIDVEERKEVVLEAQRYLLEQVPVSFDEWFIPTFIAIRNKVHGFQVGGATNGWFLAEVWVDEEA
jgi:peptide/nickel transport system substrate-binding protein